MCGEGGGVTNKRYHVRYQFSKYFPTFLLLQDPREEGPAAAHKKCKLGLGSPKRFAYGSAENTPSKKRPRLTREEDDNISVLLSSDEEDENLVSPQAMYL